MAKKASRGKSQPKRLIETFTTPELRCNVCGRAFVAQWSGPNPPHIHCVFCSTVAPQLPESVLRKELLEVNEEPPEEPAAETPPLTKGTRRRRQRKQ